MVAPGAGTRRDAFDIDPGEVYLNGGAISPKPRAARVALEEAWLGQATPSRVPFEAMFSTPDGIRERAGRALGLTAEDIGITTGTGTGMMLLAQSVRWREGDRLLLGPDEFPSNAYPWFPLEERGVRIEMIGRPGRPLTPEELERALALPGRVRALSLATVHYLTGDLHPLADLSALLHAHGALLFVDASQAAGAIALDWNATGVDAMVVSGYKWLFGPYGAGIMWVRPAVRDALANINANWTAVNGARDLTRLMAEFPRTYERHGRIFDTAETASYFNLAVFRAGLDVLLESGVAAAEAHHRDLQDRAVAAVADLPLRPITDLRAPHRSPMLMFEAVDGLDIGRLCSDLTARHVHVSLRSGRMRVSPGLWNDASDVDAFAAAAHAGVREVVG